MKPIILTLTRRESEWLARLLAIKLSGTELTVGEIIELNRLYRKFSKKDHASYIRMIEESE